MGRDELSDIAPRERGCWWFVAVAVVVVVGFGYVAARGFVRGIRQTRSTVEAVEARFGEAGAFSPRPDGVIPAERVEAFLAVRHGFADARLELEHHLRTLEGDLPEGPLVGLRRLVGGLRSGPRVWGAITGLLEARHRSMLTCGMGLGEYQYLYVVVYLSWLGHSPADGPSFPLAGDTGDDRHDELAVREARREWVLERTHQLVAPALERQLRAAVAGVRVDPALTAALELEVDLLERDRWRLPWKDGPPPATSGSLEPYRVRLETTYSGLCQPVELMMAGGDG